MDRFTRFGVGMAVLLPLYRDPPLKYGTAVSAERVPNERGTGQEMHVT